MAKFMLVYLGGEQPKLGRDGLWVLGTGKPVSMFLESYVPFAHNFAKLHDHILTLFNFEENSIWDIVTNVPSMPLAYAVAAIGTTLQSIVSIVDTVTDTVGSFFDTSNKVQNTSANDVLDEWGGGI